MADDREQLGNEQTPEGQHEEQIPQKEAPRVASIRERLNETQRRFENILRIAERDSDENTDSRGRLESIGRDLTELNTTLTNKMYAWLKNFDRKPSSALFDVRNIPTFIRQWHLRSRAWRIRKDAEPGDGKGKKNLSKTLGAFGRKMGATPNAPDQRVEFDADTEANLRGVHTGTIVDENKVPSVTDRQAEARRSAEAMAQRLDREATSLNEQLYSGHLARYREIRPVAQRLHTQLAQIKMEGKALSQEHDTLRTQVRDLQRRAQSATNEETRLLIENARDEHQRAMEIVQDRLFEAKKIYTKIEKNYDACRKRLDHLRELLGNPEEEFPSLDAYRPEPAQQQTPAPEQQPDQDPETPDENQNQNNQEEQVEEEQPDEETQIDADTETEDEEESATDEAEPKQFDTYIELGDELVDRHGTRASRKILHEIEDYRIDVLKYKLSDQQIDALDFTDLDPELVAPTKELLTREREVMSRTISSEDVIAHWDKALDQAASQNPRHNRDAREFNVEDIKTELGDTPSLSDLAEFLKRRMKNAQGTKGEDRFYDQWIRFMNNVMADGRYR